MSLDDQAMENQKAKSTYAFVVTLVLGSLTIIGLTILTYRWMVPSAPKMPLTAEQCAKTCPNGVDQFEVDGSCKCIPPPAPPKSVTNMTCKCVPDTSPIQ